MKSFSARVLAAVAVVSLLGNGVQYLHYSTSRPLVTVGSSVITKKQYQDQLEYQAGPAVLNKIVMDMLVTQAAARNGVTPTAQDVDARIAAIERRAPQLLLPYRQNTAQMGELRQDIQTGIALENLRIKDVALSPAEAAAYYGRHQAEFALPNQVKTTSVAARNSVDGITAVRLLRQQMPPDAIARHPRLKVVGVSGYRPDMFTLSPAVQQQISAFEQKADVGDARLFGSGDFYLAVQVTRRDRAVVPPLAQVQGQAERLARLERAPAPQAELAHLFQAAAPTFHSDKYAAYFTAAAGSPAGGGDNRQMASVP